MRIAAFCKSQNLTYTRYADDLTISGQKYILGQDIIESIIEDEGFVVNKKKTKSTNKADVAVRVCGLVLLNKTIIIPKSTKKKLKAAVHQKNWASALGLCAFFFLADKRWKAKKQLLDVKWKAQQDGFFNKNGN